MPSLLKLLRGNRSRKSRKDDGDCGEAASGAKAGSADSAARNVPLVEAGAANSTSSSGGVATGKDKPAASGKRLQSLRRSLSSRFSGSFRRSQAERRQAADRNTERQLSTSHNLSGSVSLASNAPADLTDDGSASGDHRRDSAALVDALATAEAALAAETCADDEATVSVGCSGVKSRRRKRQDAETSTAAATSSRASVELSADEVRAEAASLKSLKDKKKSSLSSSFFRRFPSVKRKKLPGADGDEAMSGADGRAAAAHPTRADVLPPANSAESLQSPAPPPPRLLPKPPTPPPRRLLDPASMSGAPAPPKAAPPLLLLPPRRMKELLARPPYASAPMSSQTSHNNQCQPQPQPQPPLHRPNITATMTGDSPTEAARPHLPQVLPRRYNHQAKLSNAVDVIAGCGGGGRSICCRSSGQPSTRQRSKGFDLSGTESVESVALPVAADLKTRVTNREESDESVLVSGMEPAAQWADRLLVMMDSVADDELKEEVESCFFAAAGNIASEAKSYPAAEAADSLVPPESELEPLAVEEAKLMDSDVKVSDVELMTSDPDVMKLDPDVMKMDPDVIKMDPDVMKMDPDVMKMDPDVMKIDPDVMKMDPDVTKSDADVMKSDPDVTKSDPDVMKPDPDVTKSDADVMKPDPDVTKSDADMMKSDADVMKSDADVMKLDAGVIKSDAGVMKLDPEVIKSDPDVMKLDPDVMKLDPDVMKLDADERVDSDRKFDSDEEADQDLSVEIIVLEKTSSQIEHEEVNNPESRMESEVTVEPSAIAWIDALATAENQQQTKEDIDVSEEKRKLMPESDLQTEAGVEEVDVDFASERMIRTDASNMVEVADVVRPKSCEVVELESENAASPEQEFNHGRVDGDTDSGPSMSLADCAASPPPRQRQLDGSSTSSAEFGGSGYFSGTADGALVKCSDGGVLELTASNTEIFTAGRSVVNDAMVTEVTIEAFDDTSAAARGSTRAIPMTTESLIEASSTAAWGLSEVSRRTDAEVRSSGAVPDTRAQDSASDASGDDKIAQVSSASSLYTSSTTSTSSSSLASVSSHATNTDNEFIVEDDDQSLRSRTHRQFDGLAQPASEIELVKSISEAVSETETRSEATASVMVESGLVRGAVSARSPVEMSKSAEAAESGNADLNDASLVLTSEQITTELPLDRGDTIRSLLISFRAVKEPHDEGPALATGGAKAGMEGEAPTASDTQSPTGCYSCGVELMETRTTEDDRLDELVQVRCMVQTSPVSSADRPQEKQQRQLQQQMQQQFSSQLDSARPLISQDENCIAASGVQLQELLDTAQHSACGLRFAEGIVVGLLK